MKAVVFNKYGGNEVIEVRQMPAPAPNPGDVLIKVHAASVNPVDWKVRQGMARLLTGSRFPKVLGSECAGEIVKTGKEVRIFREGDMVIGFPGIRRLSAFAEYVCVSEDNTFTKPGNISFGEASTIPVAGLTALQSLRNLGRISRNSRVLINGASGGVGTFAVQIAKIFEARVTAVASGPNAPLLKDLGADVIIDYTSEDFTKGDERYDIVFDAVSKRSFSECKGVLAPHGVYVNTLPLPSVLLYQYGIGFLMNKKARSVMVSPNRADMEWMRGNIEAGKIRVIIDRVYPLDRIVEALAYSETGKARGKIVLEVL
ncbi:MAG: NAD(P)-dependent alcohol dehydrogenase [Nitrospirae bacterium]|nr:NAD(P)-dependent alcohol dehydrogenase [Nitrospirota bacterium]